MESKNIVVGKEYAFDPWIRTARQTWHRVRVVAVAGELANQASYIVTELDDVTGEARRYANGGQRTYMALARELRETWEGHAYDLYGISKTSEDHPACRGCTHIGRQEPEHFDECASCGYTFEKRVAEGMIPTGWTAK